MLHQGQCQPGTVPCPWLSRVPAYFHHSILSQSSHSGTTTSGFQFRLLVP